MQTSDLDELKALVAELRSDRVAEKEKVKRESWTKYVSLTMVVIAVLAAIASLKGGGFSTRTLKEMNVATLNQAQASDQWAFFEAQSIKENFYQIESEHLAADPATDPAILAKIQAKVDKYEKTKADTTEKAKQFEANRDAARKTADSAAEHSRQMGLSVTLFQIAIALGAMCLIVKKKPLWFAAMILAALASGQMLYVIYFLPM